MGASRLQPAFDEGVVVAEVLHRDDVRHRPLPLLAVGGAAPAVAAVADEVGDDRARLDPSDADRQIAALGGVGAKLFGEDSFGRNGAGEHEEAAGLPIDAVDGPHRRKASRPGPLLPTAGRGAAGGGGTPRTTVEEALHDRREELVERRLDLPAAGRPVALLGVAGGGQARRLLDDDDGVIDVDDLDVVGPRGSHGGFGEHLHDLPVLKSPGHVSADVAVDHHMPRPDQLLHPRPTCPVELGAEESGQRLPRVGAADVKDRAGGLRLRHGNGMLDACGMRVDGCPSQPGGQGRARVSAGIQADLKRRLWQPVEPAVCGPSPAARRRLDRGWPGSRLYIGWAMMRPPPAESPSPFAPLPLPRIPFRARHLRHRSAMG